MAQPDVSCYSAAALIIGAVVEKGNKLENRERVAMFTVMSNARSLACIAQLFILLYNTIISRHALVICRGVSCFWC